MKRAILKISRIVVAGLLFFQQVLLSPNLVVFADPTDYKESTSNPVKPVSEVLSNPSTPSPEIGSGGTVEFLANPVTLETVSIQKEKILTEQVFNFFGGKLPDGAVISSMVNAVRNTWSVEVRLNNSTDPNVVQKKLFGFTEEADGSFLLRGVSDQNMNGRSLGYIYYDGNGVIAYEGSYRYFETGSVSSVSSNYYQNGILRWSGTTYFSRDLKWQYSSSYLYNVQSQLEQMEMNYSWNGVFQRTVYKYGYDSDGRTNRYEVFNYNSGVLTNHALIEVDRTPSPTNPSQSNLQYRVKTYDVLTNQVKTEMWYRFNEKNVLIEKELLEFNSENAVITHHKWIFDQEGKLVEFIDVLNPPVVVPELPDINVSLNEDGSIKGVLNFNIGSGTALEPASTPQYVYMLVEDVKHGKLIFSENGTYEYNPDPNFSGEDTFLVKISDGVHESRVATVTLKINAVNDAPVLSAIGSKNLFENSKISFTLAGSDVDSTALVYSATGLPSGASFDPNTKAFNWTPTYDQAGTYDVTFSVSDGTLTDTEVVRFTVANVNRAPTAQPITVNLNEDTTKTFILGGTDPDGNPITYHIQNGPTSKGYVTCTVSSCTYIPTNDSYGTDSITYYVNDGTVSSDAATITFTINPVNDAPILDPVGNKSVNENSALTFVLSGTDIDSTAITYSAAGLPPGATFNVATKTFNWTPTYSQAGTYDVTFSANDGSLTDSEVVRITVANVVEPPVPVTGSQTIPLNRDDGGYDVNIVEWASSPSITTYKVYRRMFGETNWQYVHTVENSSRYIDADIDSSLAYEYQVTFNNDITVLRDLMISTNYPERAEGLHPENVLVLINSGDYGFVDIGEIVQGYESADGKLNPITESQLLAYLGLPADALKNGANAQWSIVKTVDGKIKVPLGVYYAMRRGIPKENILFLNGVPTGERITMGDVEYQQNVIQPILNHMKAKGITARITSIVSAYHFPVVAPGRVSWESQLNYSLWNAIRGYGYNAGYEIRNSLAMPTLGFSRILGDAGFLATRIDAVNIENARRMIDDAIWAEENYLFYDAQWRDQSVLKAFVDWHGIYEQGDNWFKATANLIGNSGFFGVQGDNWDTTPDLSTPGFIPKYDFNNNGKLDNTFLFEGWYHYHDYQNVFEWARGAIGWSLDSDSGYTFREDIYWTPGSGYGAWGANIINRGAAASLGAVYEPELMGHTNPEVFTKYLLKGYSFAEASYFVTSSNYFANSAWQMAVNGDPLYSPFKPISRIPKKEAYVVDGIVAGQKVYSSSTGQAYWIYDLNGKLTYEQTESKTEIAYLGDGRTVSSKKESKPYIHYTTYTVRNPDGSVQKTITMYNVSMPAGKTYADLTDQRMVVDVYGNLFFYRYFQDGSIYVYNESLQFIKNILP